MSGGVQELRQKMEEVVMSIANFYATLEEHLVELYRMAEVQSPGEAAEEEDVPFDCEDVLTGLEAAKEAEREAIAELAEEEEEEYDEEEEELPPDDVLHYEEQDGLDDMGRVDLLQLLELMESDFVPDAETSKKELIHQIRLARQLDSQRGD